MPSTCILAEGPFSGVDHWGEEAPYWTLCEADDDGNPVTVQTFTSYDVLRYAADNLKQRRPHLELIFEADRD